MKKIVILCLVLCGQMLYAAIPIDPAQFDNLVGKVHRGDLGRSGVFNVTGVENVPEQRWKFQTGGEVKSSPVVVDGVAYFGSYDGAVYAVNAVSGALIWSNQTGARVSGSAAVVSNTVFIISENGTLFAFDATTGATNWSVTVDAGKRPAGSPAVAYGAVFIGAGGSGGADSLNMSAANIYAYDMQTGAQLWKSSATGPQGFAAIALNTNMLFAGSNGSGYSGWDLSTGVRSWYKSNGHQNRQFRSMSIVEGAVYAPGTMRGSVSSHARADGDLDWLTTTLAQNDDDGSFEMNAGGLFGYEILTDLAIAHDRVYAGCNDGQLHTFDQTTGTKGWTFQTGDKVQSSPAVAGDLVYFGSWDGKVYAVNATTGSEVWNYDLGERTVSDPWLDNGALYIGCDDGAVYCLEEAGLRIYLTPTSGLVSVPEGGTNTFLVRLTENPVTPLTVTVSRVSGDTNITVQSGVSLVFDSLNWQTNQVVTLVAAQDADAASDSAIIECSSDGRIAIKQVTATEADDDLGLELSTSTLSVPEGSSNTYQIRMTAQPAGTVTATTVRVSGGDTDLTISSGSQRVFTTTDWSAWQSITLAASQDLDLLHSEAVFRSSMDGAPDVNLTATEQDDDALGILTDVTGTIIPEGSTGTFQVKLSHQPSSSVVVAVAYVSGDPDITVTGGESLTFTTGDWSSYQTVTLSAGQDVDYLDSTATIRCSASGVPNVDVTATEADDEFDPAYSAPWSETFETTGDNAGTLGNLDGQHGWTGTGTALVQSAEFNGGSQALSMKEATASHAFSDGQSEIWISFWIKPALSPSAPLDIATNASAVFYVNTNSQVVAYDSTNETVFSGAVFSNGWNKIELYCDYVSKVWNLTLNGTEVATNLAFYGTPAVFQSLEFENSSTNLSYLDDINVLMNADSDSDGLPDDWEQQIGDADPNDAIATIGDVLPDDDFDGDGLTNWQEYIAGTDPIDPFSSLLVGNIVAAPGSGYAISWDSRTGRTYNVRWTESLDSAFTNLATGIAYPQSSWTDTLHGAASEGFYQIQAVK